MNGRRIQNTDPLGLTGLSDIAIEYLVIKVLLEYPIKYIKHVLTLELNLLTPKDLGKIYNELFS